MLLHVIFFFNFSSASMEVPGPGIKSEPQLQLTPQQWQHRILNPLCGPGIKSAPLQWQCQVLNPLYHKGNSYMWFFYNRKLVNINLINFPSQSHLWNFVIIPFLLFSLSTLNFKKILFWQIHITFNFEMYMIITIIQLDQSVKSTMKAGT